MPADRGKLCTVCRNGHEEVAVAMRKWLWLIADKGLSNQFLPPLSRTQPLPHLLCQLTFTLPNSILTCIIISCNIIAQAATSLLTARPLWFSFTIREVIHLELDTCLWFLLPPRLLLSNVSLQLAQCNRGTCSKYSPLHCLCQLYTAFKT